LIASSGIATTTENETMERRTLLGMLGTVAIASIDVQAAQRGGQGTGAQTPTGRGRGQVDPGPPITSTPAAAREKFAGIYALVIYQPHGDNPVGRIYYDRAGRMGAMLHPPGRKPLPTNPTVDYFRETQRGLVAYYGTYDVDEATSRVVHHIEAASNPLWIGTDFMRWYEFSGNRLTLRTNPKSTNVLVWERLPEK
jgi:hypothetical protein